MLLYYYTLNNKFMKSPGLRQSKIQIKTSTNRSDLIEEELELDNPENNFQKLLSIPDDIPGRQFRNLIQSMLQHCSFEKNFIKKTEKTEIPSYVRSQLKRREVFEDYEIIKDYANFINKKKHFQARRFASVSRNSVNQNHDNHYSVTEKGSPRYKNSLKSPKSGVKMKGEGKSTKSRSFMQSYNKPTTLSEIVSSKKNKMLMQDNILKIEHDKVNNILSNSKKRQKIFEEALFLQRLYDLQIEKLKEVGVNYNQNGCPVPEKFRGVEPRHIRISSETCENQQQYLRKKYVCKKRKLQFYGHAKKIEEQSLKTKKLQNKAVLSTLIKFNETNQRQMSSTFSSKLTSTQSFSQHKNPVENVIKLSKPMDIHEQDIKIKRLFLKYSCFQSENPEEMYKFMGEKQLDKFLSDFQFQKFINGPTELQQFLQQKKQQTNKGKKEGFGFEKIKYYLFDFLEILYILALQHSGHTNAYNSNIVPQFLITKIFSKQEKSIPEEWIRLKKIKRSNKMVKVMKMLRLEERSKFLFEKKIKQTKSSSSSMPLLNFDQLLQIMWEQKLFPLKVPKKSLRFIYLYCKSQQNGLTSSDFTDLLIVCGLKFAPSQQSSQSKIKWIAGEILK